VDGYRNHHIRVSKRLGIGELAMAENETREQFRERMRTIGYLRGGRTRDRVRTVTRPEDDPGLDAGRRAKQTKDEMGTVITESDHRQDVNIHPATHVTELNLGLGG
jgi:hypothetical protein